MIKQDLVAHKKLILKKKYELLKEKKTDFLALNKLQYFKPYVWQTKTWTAGRTCKQRLVMAGNQVGKTTCGTAELAYHLTGEYPYNWPGYKFNRAINAWALGVSSEQIKKVLQKEILGVDENGDKCFIGGWIRDAQIDKKSIAYGIFKGFIKEVKIKHKSGKFSTLSFLSYEQGQAPLMGHIVDFALIDEEPRDSMIYPQVVTRTINGADGDGGLLLLTFTPEWGATELVVQFSENLKDKQFFINVWWNEAPHLTQERQKQILSAYPEYQHDLRSKGLPILGEGAVYPLADSNIEIEPFTIPDHFRFLGGIDFGVKTNALAIGALDPNLDILYIIYGRYCNDMLPDAIGRIMSAQGKELSWAWPSDGHLPDRQSGKEQKTLYEDEGVNMLSNHATSSDGGVSVEAGITRLYQRMVTGRLRVFSTISEFFKEKRSYYRKNGKVVKNNDHMLDCIRYIEMSLRFATAKYEVDRLPTQLGYRNADVTHAGKVWYTTLNKRKHKYG